MTTRTLTSNASRIVRFDVVQRVAHWVNAVLFTILILTAISLFYGSFFGVVLPRHVDQEIHLWSGLVLPLPILISLLGPWGSSMRRDLQRVSYWTREELAWLRSLGRGPLVADKFNPGQKLNTLFIGASALIMLATGALLQWFRFFPVSWRSGATFVHDTLAYLIFAAIVGHLFMAFTHVGALRSIFTGRVERGWAKQHAPAWERELSEPSADAPTR